MHAEAKAGRGKGIFILFFGFLLVPEKRGGRPISWAIDTRLIGSSLGQQAALLSFWVVFLSECGAEGSSGGAAQRVGLLRVKREGEAEKRDRPQSAARHSPHRAVRGKRERGARETHIAIRGDSRVVGTVGGGTRAASSRLPVFIPGLALHRHATRGRGGRYGTEKWHST